MRERTNCETKTASGEEWIDKARRKVTKKEVLWVRDVLPENLAIESLQR